MPLILLERSGRYVLKNLSSALRLTTVRILLIASTAILPHFSSPIFVVPACSWTCKKLTANTIGKAVVIKKLSSQLAVKLMVTEATTPNRI